MSSPDRSPNTAPVLHTPDGRYIVVRGRLWRAANPALDPSVRQQLVDLLMQARRQVKDARRSGYAAEMAAARAAVDLAKRGLGERGPVWWTDGAPDLNRRMIGATPYAGWFAGLVEQDRNMPVSTDEGVSR